MTVGPVGFENHPGYTWDGAAWVSFVGPEGKPGGALDYRGTVPNRAALPAGATTGQAYVVDDPTATTSNPSTDPDNGRVFVWSATQGKWVEGPWVGVRGPAGQTLTIAGAVATASALPVKPTDLSVYMATGKKADGTADPGHLYIYDTKSPSAAGAAGNPVGTGIYDHPAGYVDLGAIAGPEGPKGPQGPIGPGPHMIPAVATQANLPPKGNPGEMCLVEQTGHVWSWNAAGGTPDAAGVFPGAWEDGGKISSVGKSAKMLPTVPDSGSMPWPGEEGQMVMTNDDGVLWSWDQSKNGGLGDWDKVGVWNYRINTAGDFLMPSNPMADGMGLVWSQGLKKWYPGLPDTAIQHWADNVDYQVGMSVMHEGRVYIALRPSLHIEPGGPDDAKSHDWKPIESTIVPWVPHKHWPPGSVVWVPDEPEFYKFGKMDIFDGKFHNVPGSTWVATSWLNGDIPVAAGEPCSVSDVPPGYARFNSYDPPTGGHLDYDSGWQRLDSPRLFFFSRSADMPTTWPPYGDGMIRHGDFGINLAGDLPMGTAVQRWAVTSPWAPDQAFWEPQTTDFAVKGVPDGANSTDILRWVPAATQWQPVTDKFGDEDNVFVWDDGTSNKGVPVYEESTDNFEVRRLKFEDLADGYGNVVPNDGDVLIYDSATGTWKADEIVTAVTLPELTDVDFSGHAPVAHDHLVYDGTNSVWIAEKQKDMGVKPWQAVDYPVYSMVTHRGRLWVTHRDALASEEPHASPIGVRWQYQSNSQGWFATAAGTTRGFEGWNPDDADRTLGATTSFRYDDQGGGAHRVASGLLAGLTLAPGDHICYTGDSRLGRDGWMHIEAALFHPGAGVVSDPPTPWDSIGLHRLTELDDVDLMSTAMQDGMGLLWDDKDKVFKQSFLNSPIIYVGTGSISVGQMGDENANYGMPTNTIPSPKTYRPHEGDQYLDTATLTITPLT